MELVGNVFSLTKNRWPSPGERNYAAACLDKKLVSENLNEPEGNIMHDRHDTGAELQIGQEARRSVLETKL